MSDLTDEELKQFIANKVIEDDPLKQLVRDRLRKNSSPDSTTILEEQKVEEQVNSEVINFRDKLRSLEQLLTQGMIRKLKIENHCASIMHRLLITTQQGREITYSELRNSLSKNLRPKFELAIIELRNLNIVKERIQYGKCYYKLNLGIFSYEFKKETQ
jgi:hypothetical protein